MIEGLLWDLRYAARVLLKRPLISGLAALSLGLGIGVNTTIFSIVNALFLRALPVHEPSTLVSLYTVDKRNPGMAPMSHLSWKDIREQSDVFSEVMAYDWILMSVSTGGEASLIFGQMVSGNYFQTLGIQAAAGRLLTSADDVTPGGHPLVVVNHAYWQRRLGGRPDVVGQKLVLNGTPFTVVGVAAAGFTGTMVGVQPDLWAPMAMNQQLKRTLNWYGERRGLFLFALARLEPGVTLSQAQAAVSTIAGRLESEYPEDNEGRSVKLVSFAESTLFPGLRGAAMAATGMLMVIVGLVLTWPTCCWPGPPLAARRSRSGFRWERAAGPSSASCSARARCWHSSAPLSGCSSPAGPRARSTASCRTCPSPSRSPSTSASTCGCWRSP